MSAFDIDKYVANPKKYLDSIGIETLVAFLEKAAYHYYNTQQTLVNDDLFDYAKDYLEHKDPKHPFLKKVGAPEDRKTKLPIWMGSQDKIRDDPKTLTKWQAKYKAPYVLSDKLDGNSGLFVFDKKGEITLYTRGDGEYGQLVNNVLPFIQSDSWKFTKPFMVRGEFIISKENWNLIKHRGANARNVVAGILHSKKPDPTIAKYLEFVVYDLIEPKMSFQEGLEFVRALGLPIVQYQVISSEKLNMDYLSEYLMKRRSESPYEIDGIVVRDDVHHPIITGKNPKYSFAFKTILTHEEAEVIVSHVEWNISKDGFLKPTVYFNTIQIGGVKIQKATGFNGSFIQSNLIGPGSHIVIIRSGDVIPYIVRILSPSANGRPSMPEIPFEWNETGVDIMIQTDTDHADIKLRQLEHFVNTLNIMHIGEGVLSKLFKSGIQTIPEFIALQKKDFLLLEGVKEKGAEKMYQSIQSRMKTVTCEELMVASNLFGRGFGLKKIQLILSENPDILKQTTITSLNPVKGIGSTTTEQFLKQLPAFYQFLKEIGFKCKPVKKETVVTPSELIFKDKTIVFTGFRNKEWEQRIVELGGKVSGSVSKSTFLVVAANVEDESSKVVKAKELKILISKDDFVKKYKSNGF